MFDNSIEVSRYPLPATGTGDRRRQSAAPLPSAHNVGDSIADRIRESLQASPDGLSREQIRNLFRGNVGSSSIDKAFEKLNSLGLVTSRYVTGRGRPTTLWSAVVFQYEQLME